MSGNDDWDDHWQRYAAAAARNPAQRMRHLLVERLLERVTDGKPDRVLDIGSGQGDLVAKLASRYPESEFVGMEMSERGVAISREKVPTARFEVADLFDPPAGVDKFSNWANQAVCSEVLEHVDSPEVLLKAAKRFLATDAVLIVTVPGGPISAFDRHIGHRRHFTGGSLERALKNAGYEVECVWRSGFPFFNLYRLLVILRGSKLSADVQTGGRTMGSILAGAMMAVFRGLFYFNLWNSRWGWQIVAVARKSDGR